MFEIDAQFLGRSGVYGKDAISCECVTWPRRGDNVTGYRCTKEERDYHRMNWPSGPLFKIRHTVHCNTSNVTKKKKKHRRSKH